jgi:hypothetical protein
MVIVSLVMSVNLELALHSLQYIDMGYVYLRGFDFEISIHPASS